MRAERRRPQLHPRWRQPQVRRLPSLRRRHPQWLRLRRQRLDPRGRVGKLSVPAAAVLVAVIGVGLYLRSRSQVKPQLTEKDTIVLADFTNTTGDPVFDGALRQGLASQ